MLNIHEFEASSTNLISEISLVAKFICIFLAITTL